MTKYDCSAADINPIGGISKTDLKRFLHWGSRSLGYATLQAVVQAAPTAELRPLSATGEITQNDEEDMGMTYAELSRFGTLRKLSRCGPVAMFEALRAEWASSLSAADVATKVRLAAEALPLAGRQPWPPGAATSPDGSRAPAVAHQRSRARLLPSRASPPLAGGAGEALLPILRDQPAQAHDAHALVPCGGVFARGQPL
jgi:hypothetical protein